MSSDLTDKQLQKIVAEMERMTLERGQTLEREEVKQILAELNLPPEMLDEAIARVNQRERLQQQQMRNRRVWLSLGVIAVATIAGFWLWFQQHQATRMQVTAVRDRITLTQTDGRNVALVNRQQVPEVFYQVTLNQAPVGDRLSLRCDWRDPSGAVTHQNRYQTKEITRSVWDTYCRLPLDAGTRPGTWEVEMFLEDRALGSAQFQVQ